MALNLAPNRSKTNKLITPKHENEYMSDWDFVNLL